MVLLLTSQTMALKLTIPYPIFSPPLNPNSNPYPNPPNNRPPTEIRFSRWNNANAEKFNQRRRAQQEIEADIRRNRRFDAATKISENYDSATTSTSTRNDIPFKSAGTPSSPSRPSIPGRKSKYSKPADYDHPAFRKIAKRTKITNLPQETAGAAATKANISISDEGLSYVIDGAPFEFKYSYTESPKVKPLKLREAAFAPFGPTTLGRPWTGRAPLPASKKKLKEFDSFQLPPPNKKGVKPVQKPGPYLPGTGPRYVSTREEILGEPLTAVEIKELVESCQRSSRQLNMGRDGLTHNMLDNIHAHWKRRRVCKIKCKGVCTVDMDNVCQQLEEKTGGEVIYRRGGVLYLFRGRNYNYRDRPRFPLMLWRPITPVYPRLIKQVPDGLTLADASEMRKKGRKLIPICKLGKNGVYCDLVKNVREAFEVCELVRINCEGMNPSDYRKIGAKLRDLVPCVLISFEREHILMWRGHNWKSSFPTPASDSEDSKESKVDAAIYSAPPIEGTGPPSYTQLLAVEDGSLNTQTSRTPEGCEEVRSELCEKLTSICDESPLSVSENLSIVEDEQLSASKSLPSADDNEPYSANENLSYADDETFLAYNSTTNVEANGTISINIGCTIDGSDAMKNIYGNMTKLENSGIANNTSEPVINSCEHQNTVCNTGFVLGESVAMSVGSETTLRGPESSGGPTEVFNVDSSNNESLLCLSDSTHDPNSASRLYNPNLEKVLHLMRQAVENGSALVLDGTTLDADGIYQRSVAFAKSAPPGPVFRQHCWKKAVHKSEKKEAGNLEVKREVPTVSEERGNLRQIVVSEKKGKVRQTNRKLSPKSDKIGHILDVAPHGSLKVDELAKLLA